MEKRRLLALLLALALALGLAACGGAPAPSAPSGGGTPAPSAPPAAGIDGLDVDRAYFTLDVARDDMRFGRMARSRLETDVEAAAEAVRAFAAGGGEAEAFAQADLRLYWELYYTHTWMTLTEIAYYRDPADEAAAAAYGDAQAQWYDAWDAYWGSLHELAVSPHAALLADAGYTDWQAAWFADYVPDDGSQNAALSEEGELLQAYYSLAAEPDPDYGELTRVFVELVRLRQEMAALYGYESYAQYAYESAYARDYAPEDMQALWAAVKESFAPLVRAYGDAVYDATWDLWASDEIDCSEQAVLDALERVLPRLSTQAYEAFRYMLDYGLYDISPSADKANVGYTTTLYYYNEPFIFNAAHGDYYDYTDMFHEFGHFLNAFYVPSDLIFGLPDNDLCELQAQGMEMLFTHFYDELFGAENGALIRADVLMNMVYSVVDGAMYDEFLQRVYAEPALTEDRVLEIYGELYEAYGYTPYAGSVYEWTGISHNYEYPFYYISYCVSALPALELYAMLEEDPAAAVETYMSLAALDPESYYYREALAGTALSDPFDPATLAAVAARIAGDLAELEG